MYHFPNSELIVLCLTKKFTTFVPDRNDSVILSDDVVCYTDGSRIEQTGLSRAGVYVQTDEEELFSPWLSHLCLLD